MFFCLFLYQCCILQLVPVACYEGGCSCLPGERRCGHRDREVTCSGSLSTQRHGSVARPPSAACPSRAWGTSIILWLMKFELFCRSLNFSASLLQPTKGENTVWCGYFLPSPLFILNVKEAITLCNSTWRRERESFGFAQCGFFKCLASGKPCQWQSARSAGVKAPGGQLRTGCCRAGGCLCSWVAADTGNPG